MVVNGKGNLCAVSALHVLAEQHGVGNINAEDKAVLKIIALRSKIANRSCRSGTFRSCSLSGTNIRRLVGSRSVTGGLDNFRCFPFLSLRHMGLLSHSGSVCPPSSQGLIFHLLDISAFLCIL